MSIFDRIFRMPVPSEKPQFDEGLYHFLRMENSEKSRIHLRIEKDGYGLLLVNASRAFHLNPVATHMAKLVLQGKSEQQVLASVTDLFDVEHRQALADYHQFIGQFNELIRPDGACPICNLELETTAPFSARPSAPYRMDLAITYRCNNDCAHCYNARPRKYPELSTEQWKTILDQLWEVGIPHIVFTGGEPTLRPDLPELIAHAEKNGQITGINTNGRKLSDPAFVSRLVDAGLDHVQITLESHNAAIHDGMVNHPGAWQETTAGLKNALNSKLFVMTNTTLLKSNSGVIEATLDYLAEMGVPTVGLNALIYSGRGVDVGTGLSESDLIPLLNLAREKTSYNHQKLIWYTPTQYCHFDPIQMELGVKGCSAALYNMCIEPDGAVIPCQSYYQSLGNIADVPWKQIWEHPLAVSLRERSQVREECQVCSLLQECGGGCPLAADQFTPRAVIASPY